MVLSYLTAVVRYVSGLFLEATKSRCGAYQVMLAELAKCIFLEEIFSHIVRKASS
jgi:hypothetical protein